VHFPEDGQVNRGKPLGVALKATTFAGLPQKSCFPTETSLAGFDFQLPNNQNIAEDRGVK
jgi:hypothetical protein